MRETMASLAILIFWKEPSIWILLQISKRSAVVEEYRQYTYVSAKTMRVRLAFSIVNFVLPS